MNTTDLPVLIGAGLLLLLVGVGALFQHRENALAQLEAAALCHAIPWTCLPEGSSPPRGLAPPPPTGTWGAARRDTPAPSPPPARSPTPILRPKSTTTTEAVDALIKGVVDGCAEVSGIQQGGTINRAQMLRLTGCVDQAFQR